MFIFKISTLEDSDRLCDTWATKCITLLGPEYKEIYETTPNRLVVYFDDIDRPTKPGSRWVAPSINQIKEVFEFSKSLNNADRLLVHCKAGVSRSTAMMIGILCQHGLGPKEALNDVRRERPQLWPNNLIIEFCDQLLELNSALINIVAEFKKKQKRRLYIQNEQAAPLMRISMKALQPLLKAK